MSFCSGAKYGDVLGTILDFKPTPTPRDQDPSFPYEAAQRMGVAISERALLMGPELRRQQQQSSLLTARIRPSGMYTVRTTSLPSLGECDAQNASIVPELARNWGAPSRPSRILVEPKISSQSASRFSAPYLTEAEAKRDDTTARRFETTKAQARETQEGVTAMAARNHFPFTTTASVIAPAFDASNDAARRFANAYGYATAGGMNSSILRSPGSLPPPMSDEGLRRLQLASMPYQAPHLPTGAQSAPMSAQPLMQLPGSYYTCSQPQ